MRSDERDPVDVHRDAQAGGVGALGLRQLVDVALGEEQAVRGVHHEAVLLVGQPALLVHEPGAPQLRQQVHEAGAADAGGLAPPMTRVSTAPSSRIRTRSTAPSSAGMPQVTPPPSNAGPAGHDAARMRWRLPTITSVLVPMSSRAVADPTRRGRWPARRPPRPRPRGEPMSGRP